MFSNAVLRISISLTLAAVISSCSSVPEKPVIVSDSGTDIISYWNGDNMTGDPSIRISLKEQKAYFYKGDQLAGVSLISTGREGLNTVTGNFHVIQKDKNHRSSQFGDYLTAKGALLKRDVDTTKDTMPEGAHYQGADMPYWMRIVGGTGLHEGFLPGYAASHGCIRMPGFMAEAFFRSVVVGTPVSVQP